MDSGALVELSHKRGRDECQWVENDSIQASKKLCEGITGSGAFVFEEQIDLLSVSAQIDGIPCFSTQSQLSSKVLGNDTNECVLELDEARRVLGCAGLEEELGISERNDYSIPASSVEELSNSAPGTWGEELWNARSFIAADDFHPVPVVVGSSGDNCPALSESFSSGNSSALIDGENCETKAAGLTNKLERFGHLDIGFLLEASDDELGIPPSPTSERGKFDKDQFLGSTMNVTATSLDDAVSWALEGTGDNMGFSDSGIEEWMTGNLDFLMETSVLFPMVPPLVEPGMAL